MTPDIENRMRQYLPLLFELLAPHNLSAHQWKTINKRFSEDFELLKKRVRENGNQIVVEASLYNVISGVINGDQSAVTILDFINNIFARLNRDLNAEQKQKIRKIVFSLLINFDHKYRNFVAELAVLSKMLSENTRLVGIEIDKITGNTNADFTVEIDGKKVLVEVVSIHFYKSMSDLGKFVNGKITKKINEKTNGGSIYNQFYLVPVLWAFPKELYRFRLLYRSGKIKLPHNVFEPVAYFSFLESNGGGLVHKFESISTLFNGVNVTSLT